MTKIADRFINRHVCRSCTAAKNVFFFYTSFLQKQSTVKLGGVEFSFFILFWEVGTAGSRNAVCRITVPGTVYTVHQTPRFRLRTASASPPQNGVSPSNARNASGVFPRDSFVSRPFKTAQSPRDSGPAVLSGTFAPDGQLVGRGNVRRNTPTESPTVSVSVVGPID